MIRHRNHHHELYRENKLIVRSTVPRLFTIACNREPYLLDRDALFKLTFMKYWWLGGRKRWCAQLYSEFDRAFPSRVIPDDKLSEKELIRRAYNIIDCLNEHETFLTEFFDGCLYGIVVDDVSLKRISIKKDDVAIEFGRSRLIAEY